MGDLQQQRARCRGFRWLRLGLQGRVQCHHGDSKWDAVRNSGGTAAMFPRYCRGSREQRVRLTFAPSQSYYHMFIYCRSEKDLQDVVKIYKML